MAPWRGERERRVRGSSTMSSSASRREAARSGELGRTCGWDGPPPRPSPSPSTAAAKARSGELLPKGGAANAAGAAAARHEGWMVRYGRRKILLPHPLLRARQQAPRLLLVPLKSLLVDGNCRVEDRGLKTHHGQIPGSTHHSLILYFVTKSLKKGSLLQRFSDGDDDFRSSRLKLIPSIAKGSWIVRQSVGSTPCLLGKAVDCRYIRGPEYIEVDVDIGSSAVANGVLGLVFGVVTSLVVDMAFLIQANTYDDLVMCVRAGRHGRLTPLYGDLPRGELLLTLWIVVFMSGTPAYDALRHPNVSAQ